MNAHFVSERPRLPAFHPRTDNRNVVNRTALHRDVSADGFKTLTAKHLACAGNMFDTHKSIVVRLTGELLKWRSRKPEHRVSRQFQKQELEVIRIERDVGIQAHDHLIVKIL